MTHCTAVCNPHSRIQPLDTKPNPCLSYCSWWWKNNSGPGHYGLIGWSIPYTERWLVQFLSGKSIGVSLHINVSLSPLPLSKKSIIKKSQLCHSAISSKIGNPLQGQKLFWHCFLNSNPVPDFDLGNSLSHVFKKTCVSSSVGTLVPMTCFLITHLQKFKVTFGSWMKCVTSFFFF